jgi:hypothetical protein
MKTFARCNACSVAQTARPGVVFIADTRPRAAMLAMFDSATPYTSGNLAGESFAATLENHPRYPSLHSVRDAALLNRINSIVKDHFHRIVVLLPGLGFDEVGVTVYQKAALNAFRAAMPTPRRES